MGTAKALLQGRQTLASLRKEYEATPSTASALSSSSPQSDTTALEEAMDAEATTTKGAPSGAEPAPKSLEEEWGDVEARTVELRTRAEASFGKAVETSATAEGTEVPVSWSEVQRWIAAQVVDQSLLQSLMQEKVPAGGLGSCFGASRSKADVPGLHKKLRQDKEATICFKMISFDPFNAMHFRMLRTLYTKLTRNRACPTIGGHWEVMGFQHTDPRTDLNRSGGVLNVIHMAWFLSSPQLVDTMKTIFVLSQDQEQEFPFALVSINITSMVLNAFLEGRLSSVCNSSSSVLETTCRANAAGLWYFQTRWRGLKRTIRSGHMQPALHEVEAQLAKPAKLFEFFQKALDENRQKNEPSKLEFTDLSHDGKSTQASATSAGALPMRYQE
mmetsp:Transcript_52127/g.124160  ORF Transcript_52127/g.124160 Transcript_52127/m.124160 type:complete len:387 (+) Transcript_52127:81-1241(+)